MKLLNITSKQIWLLGSFSVVLLLSSCADDGVVENQPQIFQLPEAQELVSATLSGRIIDESDSPIMGAAVSYLSGNTSIDVETDEYGNFLIEDVTNKGKAAFISVKYLGKFEAFRKFSLVPNRYNYTEVKMLERNIIGSVDAAEGGRLTMDNSAAITLPKGGIVNSQGASYTGDVNVAMSWIDPSADDLAQRMIGDLSGLDEDGNYRSLSSMGMLQVELLDASGNELNIGPGETAELKFPIPASLESKASSTIPLWSYNEEIGTWIQEGTAQKEGDFYVGEVSHFSSWNVDFMTDPIEITGKVLIQTEGGEDAAGSYLQVYVCSEEIGRKGGWLCDDGAFSFYNFPKGEKFKLKVLDRCGGELYVETYGPFQNDEELETIKVLVSENMVNVKGFALTCDSDPVTDGVLSIKQGGQVFKYPIGDDGSFDFTIDFCSAASAKMVLIDLENSLSKEITISSQDKSVDLGELKLCEELTNFITFEVDGREPSVFTPVEYEILEGVDSVGSGAFGVLIKYSGGNIDTVVDSTGENGAIVSFTVDASTLEIIDVLLISFSEGFYFCGPTDQGFNGYESSDITLTEIGLESGSKISGTISTTTTTCLNWQNGDVEEGILLEGSFSVTIE